VRRFERADDVLVHFDLYNHVANSELKKTNGVITFLGLAVVAIEARPGRRRQVRSRNPTSPGCHSTCRGGNSRTADNKKPALWGGHEKRSAIFRCFGRNYGSTGTTHFFVPTPVHKVLRRFTVARNASPGQYQAEIGEYLGNAALDGSKLKTCKPDPGGPPTPLLDPLKTDSE